MQQFGLRSGLKERQISASVFPSSNCLPKDGAYLLSFYITVAGAVTLLCATAYRVPTILWLRAPFFDQPFTGD